MNDTLQNTKEAAKVLCKAKANQGLAQLRWGSLS